MKLIQYNHRRLAFLIAKEGIGYQRISNELAAMGFTLGPRAIKFHETGTRTPSVEILAYYANLFCVPVDYFYQEEQ